MLLKDKIKIERWLNKYHVKNYELMPDEEYGYVVNVNESVNLIHKNLKSIDIKFNKIYGSFDCSENELTSLIGSPEKVNRYFNCAYNNLESLDGCPEIVNGSFYCRNNQLKSLIGSPKIVNDDFIVINNKITSLKGCPKIVNGSFYINNNNLKSLEGIPKIINGNFNCSNNKLTFEGIQNLLLIKINYHTILLNDNKDLGELQKITDFNEIKKILQICQEKNQLKLLINNSNYNMTKAEKINKI